MIEATEHTVDCPFCAGAGWKYVTRRAALRAVAVSGGPSRGLARRSCLDCGGRGRVAGS